MEETTTEAPKRPQFLTVLCILTFIGVGVGIIGSVIGWWGVHVMSQIMGGDSEMAQAMMEEMENMRETPGMDEAMMVQMQYMNEILAAGIIGSLICLIGALQMWKQKRTGFYIYTVGEIAPVIVTVALMGSVSLSSTMSVIGMLIPVVFITLYALNFKHLS